MLFTNYTGGCLNDDVLTGYLIKKIVVPGAILALFLYLITSILPIDSVDDMVHHHVFLLIALFTIFSLLTLYLNLRAIQGPDDKSVNRMLMVNILRILLIFGAAMAFTIPGVKEQGLFIFNFLTLYLFFLVFEIMAVISKLRRNLKRGN